MDSQGYTPEMISSGQNCKCHHCGKDPVLGKADGEEHEIYDGCIGKLPGNVMNACCGHGSTEAAYIQYWDGTRISGKEAKAIQVKISIVK